MTEKDETKMEDWQFTKLAAAVCKRKESIPELLKAAGINKTELTELTKQEATTLHYYLHPEQRKSKGGAQGGTMVHSGEIKHTKEAQCTITVSRGQRGGYGWEIKQVHIDAGSAIALIAMADAELRKKFPITEGGETK